MAESLPHADVLGAFGEMLDQVRRADVVLFDGRCEQPLSAAVEVTYARMRGLPVVAVCPDDSPYRPGPTGAPEVVLLGLCDHIARSMPEAVAWAQAIVRSSPSIRARTPDAAVEYFRSVGAEFSVSSSGL
jgi:hypothetical protein